MIVKMMYYCNITRDDLHILDFFVRQNTIGLYALSFNLAMKIINFRFLTIIYALIIHFM